MVEEVIKLLVRTETREALAKCWEYIVFSAVAILNDEDGEYGDKTNAEAIDLAFTQSGYPHEPLGIMWAEVLGKINRPHIITAEELTEGLFSLLPRNDADWLDEDALENVYPAFLNRVRSLLSYRKSRPFAIAGLPWNSRREDEFDSATVPIWSGHGVSVTTCGVGLADIDPQYDDREASGLSMYLYALVDGQISPDALEILADQFRSVLKSLLRSSAAAAAESTKELEHVNIVSPFDATDLPIADSNALQRSVQFIRTSLNSYFARPKSKESLDRRIRNAVTLLADADGQDNDALGIALAVMAIEALLSQRRKGISAALCDYVPTLLEPNIEQRNRASDFMKRAYDDRSRVLHGEKLDAGEQRRKEIRLLAGGVLYGVINRVDFLRRSGSDPQTPDDLKNERREGKWSSGQLTGVPELPRVWSLWREADQKVL